jgi:hypothetical protein
MLNHFVIAASSKIFQSRVKQACLGLAAMLALTGCAAVQVKLGMKVYLERIPITSIAVSQPKRPGIAPGLLFRPHRPGPLLPDPRNRSRRE